MLHIKLVKSTIGNNLRNRRTVIALGLRKVHQTVIKEDTPSIRGMIHHVKHMLEVSEGAADSTATLKEKPKQAPKPKATAVKSKPVKVAKPKAAVKTEAKGKATKAVAKPKAKPTKTADAKDESK